MPSKPDPLTFFRLKPIRAARVSEISETTSAAPVPPEQRVNFHIGNPLQDERLSSAFMRIALGIDVHREDLRDSDPAAVLEFLGWDAADLPKLELLIRTIQKSSPYMPRGGYSRKNPHALIKAFCAWLENQQEPLHYDTGEQSGRREIILASGGVSETLRILLFALSSYLEITPARILCYRCALLPPLRAIPNLLFEDLAQDELVAREQVEQFLAATPEVPTFLLIGDLLGEETRRRLRLLAVERPLYFIEANNAPNHLSLAREARLVQRVMRLLTPGIFAPRLHTLSTVFIAGNADFLNVLENVHFNTKGTPSASEVEFLIYLLDQKLADLPAEPPAYIPHTRLPFDGLGTGTAAEAVLPGLAERAESHLGRLLEERGRKLEGTLAAFEETAARLGRRMQGAWKDGMVDEFSAIEARELLDLLALNVHDPDWSQALQRSYLSAFCKHQPQYRPEACLVVSGSNRTALGILGFHCGISEVVIPDLSWSYEQCFPKVHAVPLTPALGLDADAIITRVEQLCRQDPSWRERGALALNNPHNATGQVLDEAAVRKLIKYFLQNSLYVVDDLAYQNVAPVNDFPEIKTARQVALELVHLGELDEAQAERVITVHSMSKTDCLAGARLAVVEIPDRALRQRYEQINSLIVPNLAAIFICYLFYRGSPQAARTYWHLRNALFHERTQALLTAVEALPPDRNPFGLVILPPTGSMYPLLRVGRLPAGLSLDWLASSLARRGIGLLPLATFARTEEGFETGRATFRLTLGGVDGAEVLLAKTRRLLIDLNRLIAEEEAHYNRKPLAFRVLDSRSSRKLELERAWDAIQKQVLRQAGEHAAARSGMPLPPLDGQQMQREFLQHYGPERLELFRTRLLDRAFISDDLMRQASNDTGDWLGSRLEREFMKDSLPRRQELFRLRSYDRTVHPTQMYSLQAELALDAIISALVSSRPVAASHITKAALELWQEYLGRNVSINSQQEADEILLDLDALITGEEYAGQLTNADLPSFLSFWSDWDGSNRPSGQGHRLVAAVVTENVQRLARILQLLRQVDPAIPVNPELVSELERLPQRNQRFTSLLNDITLLTHQLEQRYHGILPFSIDTTSMQRLATRLHLRRDPARILWQHNDRYEHRMMALRQQRRSMLEYYCGLNKQLRKQLHALIPSILANRAAEDLLRAVVGYRDILQRTVITPRIHQGMVTARDQFAIDTTVFNMYEINAITGTYGNPGVALALQVSFSTKPEALITLDRKMRIQAEQTRREHPSVELPSVWLIPLMEDIASVSGVRAYLDRVWEYAIQTRQTAQSPQDRFAEIIPEVFIAGSDLSQQASQAAGAHLYLKAKYDLQAWLAEHGASETLRIKLGSGEPMQRQGGYYSAVAGRPAFPDSEGSRRRFAAHLPAAVRKSSAYAVTPLQGVFLGADLRTFQSNLSEELRYLPARDFVSLLYHVRASQQAHRADLIRAAESIAESRMSAQSRNVQELERLTIGTNESLYEGFLAELTENFCHILYGRPEDVVGIHIISYFIGRSTPQLRDRPTSRPSADTGADRGQQILANIAKIVPLSRQGSLLRAIAHNQAQTAVLGINQLTTGMFRALERFGQKASVEADQERVIAEHLLPHLPVYEILHTLRIYQDWQGEFLKRIENAFPAGNSAFMALREDSHALQHYLPLFQQELLRRHGVNGSDFFANGVFLPELLPTLRPDLAVLLQKNLFNTDMDVLLEHVSGRVEPDWSSQVEQLLRLPRQIHDWRLIIWDVMGESLYQRVQSFSELATALYSFSAARSSGAAPAAARAARLSPALSGFFRTARADDEMRSFLIDAVEYLSSFAEGNLEVPVSIIRAMNDVERIAQIEESALPAGKQDVIRTCLLQIARLAGENG
ncbi:MAG TPA: pyridoxal phosphate-dependent aminotransferase [Anaerolineales bacterium]|nr:pyridoxal phosphate-dependent aminotransferase [Anaerolineales bacterium]